MHREEFTNTLIEDEFISALIAQIKTIAKQLKIEEINLLISQIEEDLTSEKKEMSRFTNFILEQLRSFIQSDFEEEEETANLSDSPNECEPTNDQFPNYQITQLNYSEELPTHYTTNDNSSSPKGRISTNIGIDELLEYIQTAEVKKDKKNKKKLKKKKKNKNKKETPEVEELDEEVENFKKCLMETYMSGPIKKIKPLLTSDWLSKIVRMDKSTCD
jgi:hypothetical protein